MPNWPKSRAAQASIAAVAGIIAAICEFLQIEMKSFNNFYFGPHKAYPYPYPNVHSAHMALYRDCGFATVVVFVVVLVIQRVLTAPHRR